MVENSKIEWTHHTFNPWIGCTKVSPACDHCYAERDTARFKTVEWGSGKERKRTGEAYWQTPLKWNRQAEALGVRYRVFCASLADVFDNEVPDEWRTDLWKLIASTPHLDWLLLTKRIGNVTYPMPHNVWLGISIVTQKEAERDIPKLLAASAYTRFLSMEPLLESVDLVHLENHKDGFHASALQAHHDDNYYQFDNKIDWVIVGGESGAQARPMKAEWARSLRDQCIASDVPFLFKQWGEFGEDGERVGKKKAGRHLDGRTWDQYPSRESV